MNVTKKGKDSNITKKLQCNSIQTKGWRHVRAVFTGNIPRNIPQWNRRFELLDFCFENHISQNINCAGQNGGPNGNTARNISVKT